MHDAIYGIGTDEEAVYQALMQLNKNDAKIKEFRELYASTFKADLVKDIEWDFSGKEEAKALGLLNISDEKEKDKIVENTAKELKDKPTSSKSDLKLKEKGEKLLENKYYHKHYAYIPFTGKKTGTSYKKGDFIAKEDRKATYGTENKPTWCNMFARDLIEEVTGTDPFDGDKSAKQIHAYVKKNPETFILLDDSFENVWKNEINNHEIVFLVDDGHIAVGIPTDKLHTRVYKPDRGKPEDNEAYTFGDVVQAGKSHGVMRLSEAWTLNCFNKIKLYKYVQKK